MDIIDRIAIWLGGGSAAVSQRPTVSQKKSTAEEIALHQVKQVEDREDLAMTTDFSAAQIDEYQWMPLSELSAYQTRSLGDLYVSKEKSFNDLLAAQPLTEQVREKIDPQDKKLLQKIIPFLDNREEFGVWVYKHRIGIIVTMSVYILVLSAMMFAKVGIRGADLSNSILIEIPHEPQPEPEPLPQEQQVPENDPYQTQKVENVVVDRNVELNKELKDDRKTNTSDLYREAQAVQQRLEQSRQAYKDGLDAIENIRPEAKKSTINQEETNRNINKQGNVTVAYDLKNRFVTHPEIPAYRCKGAGKVVVTVTVGQNGRVITAVIKQLSGVDDECLPEMALEAARLTQFNIDYDAPARQSGEISFLFVAQ